MRFNLYFDYCATTPIHPAVKDAMLPTLEGLFGNPSSMHAYGKAARQLVEDARSQVAQGIGASANEVIFTSGATEANNMALIGTMKALYPKKKHLIVSAIEHHAVLHTAEALASLGFDVTYLPVDSQGLISPEDITAALRPETGMISIMMVNNEVGSVQDIAAIGEIARLHDLVFHTDAVQAVNCFPINVDKFHVDLLSLSGHKIYGPKGIGALYKRNGTQLKPILFGGSQENKFRPGTENVPGIVGLGKAMNLRNQDYSTRFEHFASLRKSLIDGLTEIVPEMYINGPADRVAPHIVSVSFPNVNGEIMLFNLDRAGVAVSMGSACTSKSIEPSHVLVAMGLSENQIEGTIRISIGMPTTLDEIHQLIEIIATVLKNTKN